MKVVENHIRRIRSYNMVSYDFLIGSEKGLWKEVSYVGEMAPEKDEKAWSIINETLGDQKCFCFVSNINGPIPHSTEYIERNPR